MQQTSSFRPKEIDSSGCATTYTIYVAVARRSDCSGRSCRRDRGRPNAAELNRARPSAAERSGRREDARERRRVCTERAPVRRERSLFEKVEVFVYVRSSRSRFSGVCTSSTKSHVKFDPRSSSRVIGHLETCLVGKNPARAGCFSRATSRRKPNLQRQLLNCVRRRFDQLREVSV